MPRILAISGSLRKSSSNSTLLAAMQQLARDELTVDLYEALDQLPHFNPDLLATTPPQVRQLYALIERADGLLISCPEYARGIPGSFKNMLDWLVSDENFPGMPVALVNTSPRASDAQAALRLVLSTMSAQIIESACFTVNLLASPATPADLLANEDIARQMKASLKTLEGCLVQRSEVCG